MEDPTAKIYTEIGRDEPFYALVEAFYREVEADAPLRSLYPDDLAPGKQHLAWFLIQRFGGPAHYGEQRGHPKLRMRHLPFQISTVESEAWLRHMSAALTTIPEFAPFCPVMQRYFADSAAFLINKTEIPTVAEDN